MDLSDEKVEAALNLVWVRSSWATVELDAFVDLSLGYAVFKHQISYLLGSESEFWLIQDSPKDVAII